MTPQRFGAARKKKATRVFVIGQDEDQRAGGGEIRLAEADDFEEFPDATDPAVYPVATTTLSLPEPGGESGGALIERLDRQIKGSELLSELTRLLASSLKLEEILDQVVSRSTDVLGDEAFFVLDDGFGKQKSSGTSRERLIETLQDNIRRNPERIAVRAVAEVLTRGEPIVVTDFEAFYVDAELRRDAEASNVESLLVVPVRTRERVLGAFVSIALKPHSLGTEDLKLAGELCSLAAIAIENARLFRELQRTAITDPLTGLYNTRFFHDLLGRETARTDRFEAPLSLLMLDVDSFKQVNDTHGHVVGNKVLISVARILDECVRNTDSVFRCGGDEFGVVLPGTPLPGAVLVAEKIRSRVQQADLLKAAGYDGTLTVSVGVSQYQHQTHFETLVATADQALLEAKRSSKNCVRTAAPDPL